jgi:heat shock protein HslJ
MNARTVPCRLHVRRSWWLCVASLLIVAGCALRGDPKVEATFWQALDVNGTDLIDGGAPTLHLVPGAVTGSTGCNRYSSAGYQLAGPSNGVWRFAVGPLSVGTAACPSPEMEDVQAAFLKKLADVEQLRFQEGVLILEGPHGRLRFEQVDATDS